MIISRNWAVRHVGSDRPDSQCAGLMIQRAAAPAPRPDREHGFKSHPRHLSEIHSRFLIHIARVVENVEGSYSIFYAGFVEGLKTLSAQACNNVGNITVEGKKISGSAQHRLHVAILHHGTCMVNVDFSMLGRALRIPNPNTILVNLSEILESITLEKTKKAIRKGYEKTWGINLKKENLTLNELNIASMLYQTKYNKRDWNG